MKKNYIVKRSGINTKAASLPEAKEIIKEIIFANIFNTGIVIETFCTEEEVEEFLKSNEYISNVGMKNFTSDMIVCYEEDISQHMHTLFCVLIIYM